MAEIAITICIDDVPNKQTMDGVPVVVLQVISMGFWLAAAGRSQSNLRGNNVVHLLHGTATSRTHGGPAMLEIQQGEPLLLYASLVKGITRTTRKH